MKRVVITGATGFVGANLVRRLLHDGHEAHLLVRRHHRPWRIAAVRSDVHLHEIELADEEGLARLIKTIRPEWIFHLAAHGAYPSQTDLGQMIATNLNGTANLVAACLKTGFEAFVNTGSSSEYGFKNHPPSEDERLEPNSHYAVTKASATLLCRQTARAHRVHLPTLRLYSVYGPYEEPSRLLPTVIVRGVRGGLPPLADPATARDYVYVDDAVEAYLLAATRPTQEYGAIYNTGTGVQTTLREVAEIARRVMGIGPEPVWGSLPGRQWDTDVWVANNRKIRNTLGWQPCISFEQGFLKMVEWLRSDPELLNFYSESI